MNAGGCHFAYGGHGGSGGYYEPQAWQGAGNYSEDQEEVDWHEIRQAEWLQHIQNQYFSRWSVDKQDEWQAYQAKFNFAQDAGWSDQGKETQASASSSGSRRSAQEYRKQHEMKVISSFSGTVPQPIQDFQAAGLPEKVLKEIQDAKFSEPTPIQAQCWPILSNGHDLIGIAKSGSGKTLAFLGPGFAQILRSGADVHEGPMALVLAPTRELARQIQLEALRFGRSSGILCCSCTGGESKADQLEWLKRGCHIIVATPGRLNEFCENKQVWLGQISYLTLDEADRMLDMGFEPQIRRIIEECPRERQTLLFSATWPKDGASLVSLSDSDQDDDPEKRTAATEGKKALAADAASVTKAAKKAREAFELQELKLLDLIKSKRQALKPLQGNLAKQQPELADQLRKISEANRSVAMTKHALKRDQKVLERSQSKCAVLSKAKKFEEDQRPQVRVQVIMAISFLKAMARKAGIDLKPGAVGPSFLQLDSKDSELSEAVRSALHHIESLDDSRYEVNFHAGRWVQAEASNESDDAVTVPLESNLVQVDAAQKAASSEAADSLKNVKEMIANLIASLREEQNEDQGKQKFCADQLKKAQEKTKKLKTAQEEVEQSKRWAENAVNDLKVQSRFIEGEVKLLKEAKTSSKEELDAEEKRVKDEVKNHEATTDVMSKSQQVLVTQCELSDDLSSNCAEANAALRRATNGLKELDKYLASYLVEFSKVAEEQQAAIDKTLSAQEGSLFQTKADLNRRKDELAQLNADVVTAKENAILASKADSALATNCGPKVSSAEELIATRKEQIEQLKNAVKVLDGQAFV